MSFANKTAVVVGASGVVGSGVVRSFLDAGARVIGVSRSRENLDRLVRQVKIGASEAFVPVVGDFKDDVSTAKAKEAIQAALGGKPIDHAVSAQGFVSRAKAPTATPVPMLETALEDGLYNNFRAVQALLPSMKEREGTSFTLVSGGFAHFPPPDPSLWLGTLKNAALNALTYALAAETAKDRVRVNTLCIHLSIAPAGGNQNQFGMPAEHDTLALGPAFLGVARGTQKGQLICLDSWDTVRKLAG
ncbi:MAG TPA: SDR family oxidoreductase [Myxococcales bacterium]|jgi:NAD(P)-dependent dehydrogenase (short-subunit alcohol dehydrogenase family)